MAAEHLVLKWGALKGWKFDHASPFSEALKRYHDAGEVCFSVMQQRDSEDQKKALCEAIDVVDGEIINDWSGEKMTKDEAKKYVMEYSK